MSRINTGREPYQKGQSKPKTRKRLKAKGDDRTPEEKAYHEWQATQGCVVCQLFGERQTSRTTIHHWIMGRGGSRRTPHMETIPLCDGHHQGMFDTSKTAIHREPDAFKAKYGTDKELSENYRAAMAHIRKAWGKN